MVKFEDMTKVNDMETYRGYLKGNRNPRLSNVENIVVAYIEPWYEGMLKQWHRVETYGGATFGFQTDLLYDNDVQ